MADASNWPRTDLQRESGTGREGIEGSIEGSGDYDARVASPPAAVPLHAAEETPASIGEGILGGKSASTVGRRKALCSHWQRHGECSFGSRCHFAHGIEQSARGGKTNSANTNNTNSANSGNAANTINTNSVNTANTAGGVHASASAGADSDGGVGGGVDDGGRHRRSRVRSTRRTGSRARSRSSLRTC